MSDTIRSVERAVQMIDAIRGREPLGARLVDLAGDTGLQKTTAHRLLVTLRSLGWVDLDEATGLAHLGLPFVTLGVAASNRHGILELATPHLSRLAELTGDTVYLSVPDGGEAVCVARVTGSYPIRTLTLTVGDRRPLGLGAGSVALLAAMPEPTFTSVMAELPARTQRWPTVDLSKVSAQIEEARQRGYSVNDEALIPGVTGVGMAAKGSTGSPVAALSVASVTSRMVDDRLVQVVRWLREEVTKLESKLAGAKPNP